MQNKKICNENLLSNYKNKENILHKSGYTGLMSELYLHVSFPIFTIQKATTYKYFSRGKILL